MVLKVLQTDGIRISYRPQVNGDHHDFAQAYFHAPMNQIAIQPWGETGFASPTDSFLDRAFNRGSPSSDNCQIENVSGHHAQTAHRRTSSSLNPAAAAFSTINDGAEVEEYHQNHEA